MTSPGPGSDEGEAVRHCLSSERTRPVSRRPQGSNTFSALWYEV